MTISTVRPTWCKANRNRHRQGRMRARDEGVRRSLLVGPAEESEGMPGFYYAHVPSLGITTHGNGIDGAIAAARDLIRLWVEEKRRAGEEPGGSTAGWN
jgi:hypothetical protein